MPGEGAPVVIPARFTEDVRADFRAQNRLDFRRLVRIGVAMGWPSHRWKSCSASVDNRCLRPNRDATGDDDTNLCAYKCCAPLGPNHSSGDVLARIVSRQQPFHTRRKPSEPDRCCCRFG